MQLDIKSHRPDRLSDLGSYKKGYNEDTSEWGREKLTQFMDML
jgi:hypothetical protein